MTTNSAIQEIKSKFESLGNTAEIQLLKKGKSFTATLRSDGIEVSNLHTQKLIEWIAFEEAMHVLIKAGPETRVPKGNAMNGKLGDAKLPKESIEGHLALTVYKKEEGSSVFRRISPIAAILSWAGLCINGRGFLLLR
ncbi:MAG: hypothetical protein EOP04_12920 [Proteobacteria bacterium]|nr:MAG: hypothetical protein EOP04_12920 [Pseudomonadota bacterium]